VPGIDFTNDPLLQGRLFSYTDTQLSRLGSPNFHQIPINRPIVPVMNNQRDGHMRQTINSDKTSYQPNTISNGCPFQAKAVDGGFTSFEERNDAKKIRERMLGILLQVDKTLAAKVADGLGMQVPKESEYPINHSVPADGIQKNYEPVSMKQSIEKSDALSMANTIKNSIKTRCIAILAANGVDENSLTEMKNALEAEGAKTKVVSLKLGTITGVKGKEIKVDQSFLNTASVLFDAVYIPSGEKSANALSADPDAIHFVNGYINKKNHEKI
jgi:catalase